MDDGHPLYLYQILFFLLLLIIEALVSYAESALCNLSENKLEKQAEVHKQGEEKVHRMLERRDRYIDAIELTLAGTSILIGILVSGLLFFDGRSGIQKLLFSVVLIFVVVLFGNILPKKLALRNPEKAFWMTNGFVTVLCTVLMPLTALLNGARSVVLFLLGIRPEELEDNVTEEEIMSVLNEGHEQGILEDNEAEMISNIISFDEKEVKDVMTYRSKVVCLDGNRSVEEAFRFAARENYSRYPVFEEDEDQIIGTVHIKDLANYYLSGKDTTIPVKEIAKEPYFVPDTQDIDILFDDMQLKKIHMAIAVDEYGQTVGVVAMEDILEVIVGNIFDEHDEDEKLIIRQGDGRYLVKGHTSLEELHEVTGIEMDEEEFETVNGFLISQMGHLPEANEHTVISYHGFRFNIVDVKDKTIRYVRMVKEKPAADLGAAS